MTETKSGVQAQTAGFLGKEMFLVTTRPVRGPSITDEMLSAHLTHQVELERQGILFAAGPLYPRGSDVPEAGMFVLRASSFEEADQIAAQDPLHKAGLRSYTLQKWKVNEGRITISVHYSNQTAIIE